MGAKLGTPSPMWANYMKKNRRRKNLREDKDFAEVTFASEDGLQLKAHRVILASASPLFKEAAQ